MKKFSDKRIPLLIIEDRTDHLDQITAYLGESEFDFTLFSKMEDEIVYNYKAFNKNNQIAVVDFRIENSTNSGIDIINKILWPSDRSAYFIIFSEHENLFFKEVGHSGTGKGNNGNIAHIYDNIGPQMIFIRKILDDEQKLDETCLSNLKNAVKTYHSMCPPDLYHPWFSPSKVTENLEKYGMANVDSPIEDGENRAIRDSIFYSSQIINSCVSTAIHYNRAGEITLDIGIGVLGSFSRLEAHKNSDIEFSVFYRKNKEQYNAEHKKLSLVFWNRLMKHINDQEIKYELRDKVQSNDQKLLRMGDVDDINLFQAAHTPIVCIEDLIEPQGPVTRSQIYNKYYQIIAELIPVFNPELVFLLKCEIIKKYLGLEIEELPPIDVVITKHFFYNLLINFSFDTFPEMIKEHENYKKFCFRTLNVMGNIIYLIDYIVFERSKQRTLTSHDSWDLFFKKMTQPGIIKILSFYLNCVEKKSQLTKDYRPIEDSLSKLIIHYEKAIETLIELSDDEKRGNDWAELLQPKVTAITKRYLTLMEIISDSKYFTNHIIDHADWLLCKEHFNLFQQKI
jgi:predicted nucleotidyltransferase